MNRKQHKAKIAQRKPPMRKCDHDDANPHRKIFHHPSEAIGGGRPTERHLFDDDERENPFQRFAHASSLTMRRMMAKPSSACARERFSAGRMRNTCAPDGIVSSP